MSIKELRASTGLSQVRFADMFSIPVATLKDWEIGRRTPPVYVLGMIQTILQHNGFLGEAFDAKEARRKSVQKCLAILLTATKGPNDLFMQALDSYIEGTLSLDEMEKKVDLLEYIGG